MRDFIVKTWLAALVALVPCTADAAGLGRLVILSALGQPLNAEIDLVSVSKDELSSLTARLASPDAYRQANLQYSPALPGARLSIEKRPNGQPYIKITSSRPVNEPFIDLLVELTWPSGQLTREYTALLDPPGLAPVPAAPPVATAPEVRPAPAPVVAAPPAAPAPPVRPAVGAKEYGPIQRGETLGKIARSVMPEGVTLEQALVGLYRSNPDAFIRKNLNLVRAGKILRVPGKEELAATPQRDAVNEYRAHVADWNAYRQRLADAAGMVPAEGRAAVSGRITTRVEDKAAGAPRDVVRLSKGEPPGAAAKGRPRSIAERIRTLEEEVVAREKALTEANERIAQLETTIKDMQKLLELRSPAMAAAQQAVKPKPEAVAVAKPGPGKPAAAPKPKVAAAPPPPSSEPDLLGQILEEPLYLAAGGGLIVLGGLAFWVARRRRAQAEAEDTSASRAAPTFGMPALAAAGAAAAAPAAADVSLSPMMPSAAAAAVDEVDPLAEAEVYIAYGRDSQAEEILKEALAKDGKREELHLKLLEIYAARKDKGAFARIAGGLNKLTGGASENWLKAAAMGYALDAGDPLYAAGKGVAVSAPAAPTSTDFDFDLGVAAAGTTSTDITLEAGAARETDTAVLDAGKLQTMAAEAEKAEEPPPGPLMPEFTLEVPKADEVPTQRETTGAAPPAEASAIDFNIELPQLDTAEDEPTVIKQAPESAVDLKLDIGDIDLNLDEKPKSEAVPSGGEKDGHWYDVQTKFDLAKAYQEMGDKDGAKEILREVINEGDAEQKAQAQALLESLG